MSNPRYHEGDHVVVNSPNYGDKYAVIEEAFISNGVPIYKVDIEGIGRAQVTEYKIRGKTMKSFSDKVDSELKKRMTMTSDEYSESGTPPKAEVQDEPAEGNVQVPGGAPGPKSPGDMKKNPNDAVNEEIVDSMGAK